MKNDSPPRLLSEPEEGSSAKAIGGVQKSERLNAPRLPGERRGA